MRVLSHRGSVATEEQAQTDRQLHVNNAAGVQERFMVDTVDEICAMVKAWMQSGPGLKLVGKTYDMRKARATSVSAFLRLSQAIKVIGISCGNLVWSSFYDDFVCVCRAGTEDQTDRMVRKNFQVTGLVAVSGRQKRQTFCKQVPGSWCRVRLVDGGE